MARAFRVRARALPNYHIVGDSTAAPIEQRNNPAGDYTQGHGSTNSGRGYTSAAIYGTIELTPPEQPFVICHVSVWDYLTTDFRGYETAHNFYVNHGITPTWVALPPSPALTALPLVEEPALATFNDAVAAAIGVTLEPYAIRVTTTLDGVHPNVAGAQQMVDRYAQLVATSMSRLRGTTSHSLRGQGTVEQPRWYTLAGTTALATLPVEPYHSRRNQNMRLASHMSHGVRGVNLWMLNNGTVVARLPVDKTTISRTLHGGHDLPSDLSQAELTLLLAGGHIALKYA